MKMNTKFSSKFNRAWIMPMICCLLLGCGKQAPNAGQVQTAVSQVVEWVRVLGDVQVLGVQENPQANEATADLQFNNFQYKANNFGTPIAKTTPPPREPDVNSPSFYQEMATWPSRQWSLATYSGRGTATLKWYDDGRWVLTGVQFNFQQFNANVPVLAGSFPPSSPLPSVPTQTQSSPQPPPLPPQTPVPVRAQGGPYVIISRCHACSWENWQRDTVKPLSIAGFHSVIGKLNGGDVSSERSPTWITDIVVGPFPDDGSAKAALKHVAEIIKPLGEASGIAGGSEEVAENRIQTAGYFIVITR